jgi:hypothetical protein
MPSRQRSLHPRQKPPMISRCPDPLEHAKAEWVHRPCRIRKHDRGGVGGRHAWSLPLGVRRVQPSLTANPPRRRDGGAPAPASGDRRTDWPGGAASAAGSRVAGVAAGRLGGEVTRRDRPPSPRQLDAPAGGTSARDRRAPAAHRRPFRPAAWRWRPWSPIRSRRSCLRPAAAALRWGGAQPRTPPLRRGRQACRRAVPGARSRAGAHRPGSPGEARMWC